MADGASRASIEHRQNGLPHQLERISKSLESPFAKRGPRALRCPSRSRRGCNCWKKAAGATDPETLPQGQGSSWHHAPTTNIAGHQISSSQRSGAPRDVLGSSGQRFGPTEEAPTQSFGRQRPQVAAIWLS